MNTKELLKYEMPSIAEYCSIGWIQNIIAWCTAKKINRKTRRYNARLAREAFVRGFKKKN